MKVVDIKNFVNFISKFGKFEWEISRKLLKFLIFKACFEE